MPTDPSNPQARTAEQRSRDPQRTRQALLDAARAEFADKGFAGARVDAIAARAGVNKQMISYHFGGKDGLYQAILDEWRVTEQRIADPERPLADVFADLLRAAYDDPDGMRFAVRAMLDQDPADVVYEADASEVVSLRARQHAGEIADDLDPPFVLFLLNSIIASSTVYPAQTKRILGFQPGSPEHHAYLTTQLRALIRHLQAPPNV